MEEILDRSGQYLRIFNSAVRIDKNLPKWQVIGVKNKEQPSNHNRVISEDDYDLDDMLDLGSFLQMDKRDFNIYLGKRMANDLKNKYNSMSLSFDNREDGNFEEKKGFVIRTIKKLYRKYIDSDKDAEEEEVFEFDIFEFFNRVKLTSKENQSQYALRIEPYMIALKQANDMGQKALADQLTAELFNNKYESILYAEGFHFKITEAQVVDFIKKTEKGVQLCYIENFIRPVPKEVIEVKKKADSLLVFDNYCVMYYDPEKKSYKQTKEEEEAERRKKADPILFGMISGSRNLYYITDWIDEYCDLTLEEFLKVSGIEKEHLKIDEKIKI